MRKKLQLHSLKSKLISIFVMLSIIPLIVATTAIFTTTNKRFTSITENQQEKMIHIVQSELTSVSEDLLKVTELYSQNGTIISSFESGEREQLLNSVEEVYSRLSREHQLSVFELGDSSGTVVLRGHNPDKYGDNKSDLLAIQYALDGKSVAGFEFGSSGLSVRAFTPIVSGNKVIGTIQTGVDSQFINDLSEKLQGITVSLYDMEGLVVQSSSESKLNTHLESSLLSKVNDGQVSTYKNQKFLESILPIYDPTGNKIIAAVGIQQDISILQQSKQEIFLLTIILIILTVIIVSVISFFMSKRISKPVVQVANVMNELSKGNLQLKINESTNKDEIGQLTNATRIMQKNLHEAIVKVTKAATGINQKSDVLKELSNSIQIGSEQISSTMQELAYGNESEAQSISDLASNISDFKESIEKTNQSGEKVYKDSFEVLKLTSEGTKLMQSSNEQMNKINFIMQDVVEKMKYLNNQTKEIEKLVFIIEQIANQTNLLALNAAIEAARAGEHGKGFAVVADEVKKLAEQVSLSVTDITQIVSSIQNETTMVEESLKEGYSEVQQGTTQIHATSETFTQISSSVTNMAGNIEKIITQLSENVSRIKLMNESTEEVAAVSEESAAAAEETAATANEFKLLIEEVSKKTTELDELAILLKELVDRFKL